MTKLLALKSITFAYDPREDRILAIINVGQPEAWSCWLTRRLVLALLDQSDKFLASTSALAQRATSDVRGEVAAFEREAAIAKTASAMSPTPPEAIKTTVATAELAQRLTLAQQGDRYRIELRGMAGGGADGLVLRAELQRILQMLQAEVVKGSWVGPPAHAPTAPLSAEAGPKPARH